MRIKKKETIPLGACYCRYPCHKCLHAQRGFSFVLPSLGQRPVLVHIGCPYFFDSCFLKRLWCDVVSDSFTHWGWNMGMESGFMCQ